MIEEVAAFAPASVSNLGPGFDVLGAAVDGPGDVVVARRRSAPGVALVRIEGDGGALPLDARQNTAAVAAAATLARAGVQAGVELELHKGLPIGSGLGSSAASAVAAAFATNLLIGSPLRKRDLVEPCLDAEAVVSGRHADNVAPSLLGGLVLIRRLAPLDVLRLPVPEGLWLAVVTPELSVSTREARDVLPAEVPLAALVATAANLGGLVSACYTDDLDLLARCIVDDVVAPRRLALIPGGPSAIDAALAAGALGSTVSGAGPSIVALCRSARDAARVAAVMVEAFAQAGYAAASRTSSADCPGVRQA